MMTVIYTLLCAIFFSMLVSSHTEARFFEIKKIQGQQEVDSLYDLAWDYLYTNQDSSLIVGYLLLDNSQRYQNLLGEVKAYYVIGYAYYLKNNFGYAAENYYKGLESIENQESQVLLKRKLLLLQNLGVVYEKTYNYDLSKRYFEEALKIAEELDLKGDLEVLYHNIGIICRKKEYYDSADYYYNRSLSVNEDTKDFRVKARSFNALGNVYLHRNEYSIARSFYEKALQTCLKDENVSGDRIMYESNIGESYFLQDDFHNAVKHYKQAQEICIELNDSDEIKSIYNNIGDVYFKQGHYDSAIYYFTKCKDLGKKGSVDIEFNRSLINTAEAYDSLGNYKMASMYKSKYIGEFKEVQLEQMSTLGLHEFALRKERDDQKRALVQKENETVIKSILLGASILILLASAWWGYRYYQKVRKVRRLVAEMEEAYRDTLSLN